MFVLRFFAGPIAHRISPIGLLTVSAALAAIGLWLLAGAATAVMAIAGATVFYVGVCYFWPTMLAVISERFPKTGALGMGLMAASGFLGSAFVIERMGSIYDTDGPAAAFRFAAWLPVGLFVVFTLVWLGFRARGGYRVEQLGRAE